jgi:transglutaminase-like putative cysteine protease
LYDKTCQQYERLIKERPQDVNLRLKAAKFYYEFNDFEKVEDLIRGIENKDAKILLAKAYARLKEYNPALEIFEQLGETNDNEYLYLYAKTLEEQNLFSKAVPIYQKLKPPFKKLGEERIRKIGIKIEEGVPEEIENLLKEESTFISRIDKEEAAILLVDEVIEIKDDNTAVSTAYVVEKILREKGKDLAEVEIGYDSTYERVELEYARTITPGGKIVYAGAENIRDVSKYLNFPLYSNAKALIISMPSVEVGSIIEYKVKTYTSKLINDKDFTYIYSLKNRYPIGKANFKLLLPKNRKVRFKFLNEEYAKGVSLSPLKEETEKKTVYSWKFKEIEPIIPEDGMPHLSLINPAIVVSSFDSWDEVYAWWYKLYKDKITLNDEVKNFLKDLIKDCKDDLEKAKKVYEFCAKNIRYVAVEYGDSGHEPHKAIEIFWNRYGDCKDKATLLVAMLREAGLKAYPVLIPTREAYTIGEDFPSVNFNHAIAALVYKGEVIFVDATASTVSFFDLPLDDQERKVLVFFDDGHKILTTPLIMDNEITYEMNIDIDNKEDAKIERRVTTKGYFTSFHRYYLKYTHPQNIEDDIKKKIIEISPFSKLIDYKIENVEDFDKSPVLRYSFQTKKLLNPADNLRIIPYLSDIDIDVAYASKEERNFPVEFDGIFKKISTIKVKLPTNLKVKYLPQNKELHTEWFDFKSIYQENISSLDLHQEFAIKKRFVKKEEYAEFKKRLEEVFFLLREEVIFEMK